MNIWIAKLGREKFSDEHVNTLKNFLLNEFENKGHKAIELFEYKSDFVHYFSFQQNIEYSKKSYNYVDSENRLTAYSGLLIGKSEKDKDYRKAKSIHNISGHPTQFSDKIAGDFAVVSAKGANFKCFVDNTGLQKVFYYGAPSGEVFISNYIDLIQLFKRTQINFDAFLDWISINYLLREESEEQDVFTMPMYGHLTWSPENGLNIDQYQDLSEIFYNSASERKLLDNIVFEFRNCAENLLSFHNCVVPLSGGYDSRLILSMFWGLDKSGLDSYTFYDSYDDIHIARRVAKDNSITNKFLALQEEVPTLEEIDEFLLKKHFPFGKYSKIFEYLARKSIDEAFPKNGLVQLKGFGGNSDRRILQNDFLDNYEPKEAIHKFSDHLMKGVEILNEESRQYMKERIISHYSDKYLPIMAARGRDHRLKCILYKEKYRLTSDTRNTQIYGEFEDWFLPLLMDSFQTLIFSNATRKKLIRGKKNSIYHQLFRAFTYGEDKPIHFTSGLHWDANKLSRGFYRLQKNVLENYLKRKFNYKEKNTLQIKRDFFQNNISAFQKILNESDDSFIWDYVNRDLIKKNFANTDDYNNELNQITFKKIIPLLKMEKFL